MLNTLDNQKALLKAITKMNLDDPNLPQGALNRLLVDVHDIEILEIKGSLCQALNQERPTLKILLTELLYGRIDLDLYDALLGSFKNIKERYIEGAGDIIFAHLFTTKGYSDFVKLASKTDNSQFKCSEQTVSFDCLYTNDPHFSVDAIPTLTSKKQVAQLSAVSHTGVPYLDKTKCYILSILTMEMSAMHSEAVRDYLVYIPDTHIISYR